MQHNVAFPEEAQGANSPIECSVRELRDFPHAK
jgi:hypothetical protein